MQKKQKKIDISFSTTRSTEICNNKFSIFLTFGLLTIKQGTSCINHEFFQRPFAWPIADSWALIEEVLHWLQKKNQKLTQNIQSHIDNTIKKIHIFFNINLLLTEHKRHSGEYWPKVVAIQNNCNKVLKIMAEGQYFPAELEQARLVNSLLYGTKQKIHSWLSSPLTLSVSQNPTQERTNQNTSRNYLAI